MSSSDVNTTLCHPRPSFLSSLPKPNSNTNEGILAHAPLPAEIPENHVLIKVDRFGYSANNVTYQILGEAPHFLYFAFHPAPEAGGVSAKTHGVTPVWGFGTVVKSTVSVADEKFAIKPGERVYGYLAPAKYLLLPVDTRDVNAHAFFVPRPQLPADRRPYNMITRCAADPMYNPDGKIEDLTMLYRPLYWTAFWFEDCLHESGYRGISALLRAKGAGAGEVESERANRVLLSSASSKTAFCIAYCVRERRKRENIAKEELLLVGLTSERNKAFTERLGLYDVVVTYPNLRSSGDISPANGKWIYVDVAGNEDTNKDVLSHLGGAVLKEGAISIGLSSVAPSSTKFASADAPKSSDAIVESQNDASSQQEQAKMQSFFMPEWLQRRRAQLSVEEIAQMQKEAWAGLMRDCGSWGLEMVRVSGAKKVEEAYKRVVGDGIPADKGYIWSLWEEQEQVARL